MLPFGLTESRVKPLLFAAHSGAHTFPEFRIWLKQGHTSSDSTKGEIPVEQNDLQVSQQEVRKLRWTIVGKAHRRGPCSTNNLTHSGKTWSIHAPSSRLLQEICSRIPKRIAHHIAGKSPVDEPNTSRKSARTEGARGVIIRMAKTTAMYRFTWRRWHSFNQSTAFSIGPDVGFQTIFF